MDRVRDALTSAAMTPRDAENTTRLPLDWRGVDPRHLAQILTEDERKLVCDTIREMENYQSN